MKFIFRALASWLVFSSFAFAAEPALDGVKDIILHTRDGKDIVIGTVTFTPQGEKSAFAISFDDKKFAQYFLSMREFKCVEGDEIHCHVRYPYANPRVVTPGDLSWLEHALLFLYKRPSDYGARMGNGLIYTLKIDGSALIGTPRSIDLDEIAAPPDNLSVGYYGADQRSDVEKGARWIESLRIEAHR